jgi:pSer/pThr/pTyr-binding forkhead associated (FHA) protein
MPNQSNHSHKEESYNWEEVLRPEHLRLVFSSMATALDISVTESVILGRSSENAIVDIDLTPYHASDFGVSRQHALIAPEGDGFVIQDLGSSNGTSLNGERLEANKPYPIHDGDMLFLGRMAFSVRFLHDGARLSRRLPRTAASVDAQKKATRMLEDPNKRETTRTVEMRGLLKKLGSDADTKSDV